MRHVLFITCSLLAFALAGCNPVSDPFVVTKNVPYGDHARQVYDVYEPPYDTGRSLRPAVFAIHGGGWNSGDKEWAERVASELCPRGYVVFAPSYRLSTDAVWPAQLDDVRAAYAHAREQEWAHVDVERVAAFGVSAGGHLALMLHLRDGGVRPPFAIASGAPTNLVDHRDLDPFLEPLLDVAPGGVAPIDSLVDVSPVSFIRSDANVLLVHSTGDPIVDYVHAEDLHTALLLQSADVTLLTDHGASHSKTWEGEVNDLVTWLSLRQGPPRDPDTLSGLEDKLRKLPERVR